MAGPIPAAAGRIFISYRREETAYPAGWLFDRLVDHFGRSQVFKDVDSIELGDDFVEVITAAVGSCDVLLALIGEEWLTITDAHGRRRLDNPDDFVRLEIEAALTRRVRVIPILVDGARMPRAAELPDSLARLVRRQALELSPARFDFDTGRLLRVLDRTLTEVRTEQEPAASTRQPAEKAPEPSTTEPPKAPERPEQAEPGPTPGLPPAAPATLPAARPAADQSTPPDPSTTEVQEAPERPEQAGQRRAPSTPLSAPATAARTRPPSDSGKPLDKQRRHLSTRARVLAGAGVGVVLILLIVAIVANSGTTPPPTGEMTTSPPTTAVIFQDDFSSRANGWDDTGSKRAGGHYKNGAYRVYTEAVADGTGEGGAPQNASRVYPSAPPSLRIEVEARMLTGDQYGTYGTICRVTEERGYSFAIGDGFVTIVKYTNSGSYDELANKDTSAINTNGINRVQTVCSSQGQQAVHLVFSLNGKKVAEATDTKNPYLTGTVGVFAATGPDAKKAIEAEFDNFAVTQA
jgi:hypothetical protein